LDDIPKGKRARPILGESVCKPFHSANKRDGVGEELTDGWLNVQSCLLHVLCDRYDERVEGDLEQPELTH
jgi:hypothetical protein